MNVNRERNSELLMKSAIELFQEYGYSNVSVNQICKASGVARSTFYSMFSDKDDLVIHIYNVELTKTEELMERFALQENDLERIWLLYEHYISLAIRIGPVVSAAMMIIELNRNIGIYDTMMKVRKWSIPLCKNCQKQGIVRNPTPAEDLIPMVSASLNNFVFEWCRCKGNYPVMELARKTVEDLLEVSPEYRKQAG
ncbi:MAG: TetR/AcrR family transcriptional regulator [Oscillospiraceae bacterium]|nr:TetR/AcrR family transcriptional regulator [Oscillospiraceae bacterium]